MDFINAIRPLTDKYVELCAASPLLVILFWKLLEAVRKGCK